MRTALIFGITGQDGAYLSRLLLGKEYEVHGFARRSSGDNLWRLRKLGVLDRVKLHHGDMTDGSSVTRIVDMIEPDEVYNLAAQSHVGVSFEAPVHTIDTVALGTARVLEALRDARYYQASTSEMFGNAASPPYTEDTPFAPVSPYAAAKLCSYWMTRLYRDGYGLHASNGILFNHESPLRSPEFVSRKITLAAAAHSVGKPYVLKLGDLDARRDWGHADDYVRGMWMMLQQPTPGDYVLATGESRTVRQFVETAFRLVGCEIAWDSEDRGRIMQSGEIAIVTDTSLRRPRDPRHLCGDAAFARRALGWKPRVDFEQLVREMVEADCHAPVRAA